MIDACDRCLCHSHLAAHLSAQPGRIRTADRDPDAQAFRRRFDPRARRAQIEAVGIRAACSHSSAFPAGLRDLNAPPHVLYTTAPLTGDGATEAPVALIGSRHPSEYGRTVAYALGRDLGAAGITVISGLALGIDAIAHRGCLDGGGSALAVLASGVDVPYPRSNRALYNRIVESGVVLSEMPPGTRPRRWLFPARNRIMAALARLTVVVEATERSGTLITADAALAIGREVAAVPGRVTSAAAAGTNGLLRNGAALVTGAQDVLDLLYGVGARTVPGPERPALDRIDSRVLEAVSRGEGPDVIGASLRLDASALRAALARLELAGRVRRTLAGDYVPAA